MDIIEVLVSVPSTGRSGLQQASRASVDIHANVSVPSTGRSGLQPYTPREWIMQTGFQYPLRVEVGCN